MSYQEIMPLLHRLEPEEFRRAASAFQNLGAALEDVRQKIEDTGNSLAENKSWRGEAAQKAMNQFQKMHDQAAVLSVQSKQAYKALDWFGRDATPPYQSIPDPKVLSGWKKYAAEGTEIVSPGVGIAEKLSGHSPGGGQDEANTAARSYMNSYNQQIGKLNQALPAPGGPGIGDQHMQHVQHVQHQKHVAHVEHEEHEGSGPTKPGPGQTPNTPGTGGVPSSKPPSGANPFANPPKTPNTPGTPHPPNTPNVPNPSHTPSVPNNSGQLQGYNPPSGGGPSGGGVPTAPTGGGSANPFARGGVPMMPEGGLGAGAGTGAGGSAGKSKGIPGEEEGPDAGSMSGEGAAGKAGAAEGEAAEAAQGRGANAIPGGGAGGGGQQNKERQRQAWLNEDNSVWGVPDEDIGPIIG